MLLKLYRRRRVFLPFKLGLTMHVSDNLQYEKKLKIVICLTLEQATPVVSHFHTRLCFVLVNLANLFESTIGKFYLYSIFSLIQLYSNDITIIFNETWYEYLILNYDIMIYKLKCLLLLVFFTRPPAFVVSVLQRLSSKCLPSRTV